MSPTIEVHTPPYQARSLVGFELYGPPPEPQHSNRLGEILEVVIVGDDRYLLLDSRHWTYGSRRLLPTWAITSIDLVEKICSTELPVDVIRRAPDFDPFRLSDPRYQAVLQNVFGSPS